MNEMMYDRKNGTVDLYHFVKYDNIGLNSHKYITSTLFPEQDESKLGTVIPLWYINEGDHITRRGEFTVVRWDLDGNRVILINNDLQIVLVATSDKILDDGTDQRDEFGNYVANIHVHKYSIQYNNLLGVETEDIFFKDSNRNKGIIIRADVGGHDPQFVILEDASKHRIITLDETHPIVKENDIREKTGYIGVRYDWWPTDWGINK